MCVLKYMNNKHAYQYEENNAWQKKTKKACMMKQYLYKIVYIAYGGIYILHENTNILKLNQILEYEFLEKQDLVDVQWTLFAFVLFC